MDRKTTGIVAYISWIGLIIAYFAGDREGAKFHINQALVIWSAYLILGISARVAGFIPVVGAIIRIIIWLCAVVLLIFVIMGIISACKEEEKPLPIIGSIKLLK